MSIPFQVSDRLRAVFASNAVSEHRQGAIARIVDQLADGSLAIETVDQVAKSAKGESPHSIRRGLVRLLVHYLDYATRDGQLSADELADARFLNLSFRIRAGEVLRYQKKEVRELVDREMHRILSDEIVDQSELDYQTELQAALGLGYDEFRELSRRAFDLIVERWIARIAADEIVSDAQFRAFDAKMRQLATVYPLTPRQKRELGIRW